VCESNSDLKIAFPATPRIPMKPLNVLVSLITEDNDFQMEQAASAKDAAARLGAQVQIVYAGNDAVNQNQQVFLAIQRASEKPDAILVEAVGTGMAQAASAAVSAGIGWAIVNREVDYISRLRRDAKVPIFSILTDNAEVGRIQAAQLKAMATNGCVLYIEGPSGNGVAQARTSGMRSGLLSGITLKALKGDWTELSGYHAAKSWLSLSTSRQMKLGAVACQNDAMAIGARRAFDEVQDAEARREWLKVPFIGCDGVSRSGQEWVRRGLLRATVVTPAIMGQGVEIMINAIRAGNQPAEITTSRVVSLPSLEALKGSSFAQSAR